MSDAVSSQLRSEKYWHGAFTGDVITLKESSVYKNIIEPGIPLTCIEGGSAHIMIEGFEESFHYLDFDIVEQVYTGSRYY